MENKLTIKGTGVTLSKSGFSLSVDGDELKDSILNQSPKDMKDHKDYVADINIDIKIKMK